MAPWQPEQLLPPEDSPPLAWSTPSMWRERATDVLV